MNKQLDILYVNGNGSNIIYQELATDYAAIEPPVWCALLAQHTRSKGFTTAILDCEAERLNLVDSANKVLSFNPRLIVMVSMGQQPSASTQNMAIASRLAKKLKDICPECKIAFMGAHPSTLCRETLMKEKCDFVIQGEGTRTLDALCLCPDLNDPNELDKVPSLWFRKGIFIRFTPFAEPIAQSDLPTELPGMAWDLLPMEKYRTANWHALSNNNERQPFASLYTSLGCVYSCSFCMINSNFGNNNVENAKGKPSFRYWDTDFIMTQFDEIARRGIRNVKIADEMFVLYPEHYASICQKIVEKGYNFNIWAYSRINTVDEGYLDLMKKAGINWLALGIESGSPEVRKGVIKGSFKDVKIVDTVKKIQDAGINVIGNFIVGLPDDTIETMNDTLELATELNCEFMNVYSCMSYPGSSLYLDTDKNVLPESYEGYSQHSYECFPLSTKHISNVEVLRFRDEMFQKYFTNERYLKMVETKFGLKAREEIEKMTKTKLKRKLLGD